MLISIIFFYSHTTKNSGINISSSSSSSQPNVTAQIQPSAPPADNIDAPSSSHQRSMNNEVWLEPVVEALATQLAIDASHFHGRLSAASALIIIFQVCSTWREMSRSDLLWQRLTRHIWCRTYRLRDMWQLEYIYWHRTTRNFRTGRHALVVPQYDPGDPHQTLICRCLTLSSFA
ncbi:hypothetical protein RYX36_008840 [Vicia faba]